MREIRFKAWEPETKKMFTPTVIPNPSVTPDRHDGILMQYTGLKDKNGKEIYEGDIVDYQDCEGEHGRGVVVFEEGRFIVRADEKHSWWSLNFPTSNEVIGNIYENPELIK